MWSMEKYLGTAGISLSSGIVKNCALLLSCVQRKYSWSVISSSMWSHCLLCLFSCFIIHVDSCSQRIVLCCYGTGIDSIMLYLCRCFFQWLQTSLVRTCKQGKAVFTGAQSPHPSCVSWEPTVSLCAEPYTNSHNLIWVTANVASFFQAGFKTFLLLLCCHITIGALADVISEEFLHAD